MRLVLAVLALAITGCAKDACEDEPPSFQLDLSSTKRGARSVIIELSGAERRRRTFELGSELDDGSTSIAIEVQEIGEVTISVRTYSESSAMGVRLEEAEGRFSVAGNGCNRFSLALSASPGIDAGLDAGEDAGSPDAFMMDAGDAGPFDIGDANPADADPDAGQDAEIDSGEVDGGDVDGGDVDAGPVDVGSVCTETADSDTVALYRMEQDVSDETGNHDGTVIGNAAFLPTFTGCGDAIGFDANPNPQGWGRIEDDPAFDLTEGSIDLWIQLVALPTQRAYGVVSRDSSLALPGHLTVYVACDGTVIAKLGDVYRCSDQPVAPGAPAFVAVNFGPPTFDLFVNGVASTRTDAEGLFGVSCGTQIQCGGIASAGIDGTDNPWIIGASADASTEGTGGNLSSPFREGRVDSLRISSVRRF